eukprot:TRINITY_DN1782_c1_g1_i8.p1 TRINITY_DN1782_c1_g1~~TRINITY_DN1782_c1_g1_i8.p1  ORF type:complete len:581 (-),score=115.58 TRINITY_DN1782_c1_g1_i8:515-2137(-)
MQPFPDGSLLFMLLVLLIKQPVLYASSDKILFRGVSEEYFQRYAGNNGQFSCFDNSKTIPIKWVNDDYCDCFDGSDEPGTSACFNSVFFCRNRGYQPKYIYGVFVDDGVCDCCDGSDESLRRCNNTCVENGKKDLEKLLEQEQSLKKGLELKAAMIKNGYTKKQAWEKELQELEKKVEEKKPTRDQLKEKRDKLQAEEDERQRIIREQEEAERRKQEEEEAAKKAEEDAVAAANQDSTQQEGDMIDESQVQAEQDQQQDQEVQQQQQGRESIFVDKAQESGSEQKLQQQEQHLQEKELEDQLGGDLSDEELGKKIASQWTHDPEAVGDLEEFDDFDDHGMMYDHDYEYGDAANYDGDDTQFGANEEVEEKPDPHPELTQAKLDYDAVNNEIRDAENQIKDLEAKLLLDFGPNGEYMSLADECYETKIDKYTYKMCPFGKAQQDSTSLGDFRAFEENYVRMVFDKGAHCWSGPSRSLTVTLVCGSENTFTQVEEPSRCEYTGIFYTPLACTTQQAEDVTNKYKMLQAELQEVELSLKHTEL